MQKVVTGATAAALALAAGCSDPAVPRTITVHAHGATLAAVDDGGGWQVHPAGDVVFDEPAGLYRVSVTCRPDIGDTTFVLAAPGDPAEYDLDCPEPTVQDDVTFDVTGALHSLFIGEQYTYLPSEPLPVDRGRHDVVAIQEDAPEQATRAQVIRDVDVDGATRIAVDIGDDGVALAPIAATLDPAYDDFADLLVVGGETAAGTYFSIYARPPVALPASVLVDGDEQWLRLDHLDVGAAPVYRQAVRTIVGGAVDLPLPVVDTTATFTADPRPALTWSTLGTWDAFSFSFEQDNEYGVPGWRLLASHSALEQAGALAAFDPPPGWRSSWTVDLAGYYRWSARASRTIAGDADGWEAITQGGGVYNPVPPPR
ncbi:MAG TPA: hypothetical protein VHE35_03230 [Kofleriaceae bacterium]|nr:hypothetical protein [Kofleriaceae bacterium]